MTRPKLEVIVKERNTMDSSDIGERKREVDTPVSPDVYYKPTEALRALVADEIDTADIPARFDATRLPLQPPTDD